MQESDNTSLIGRRSFLRFASMTAVAAPILTEAQLAWAADAQLADPSKTPTGAALHGQSRRHAPSDAVLINANENPLGPCKTACSAITEITPTGGRYDLMGMNETLTNTIASLYSLKPENIALYAGSSEPLHYTVLAFTSPTKGLVLADPTYEAPVAATLTSGAKVTKVPLTAGYAHDVKAMIAAADANTGVIYICNPNNPTGTITSKQDIVWALENKPKGSILLVDEAYIHLSDADHAMDLVAAGKDLIVLRTFSKIYGMAGIRCGYAVGRPDLLAKLAPYGQNSMPVTALAAANASLLDKDLVPIRKKIIGDTRRDTIAWLRASGYTVIGDSQTNCFMIDTGRNGKSVIAAMKAKDVWIGRTWPIWPNAVRVSVGTPAEMAKFKVAFKEVMSAPAVAYNDTHAGPQQFPQYS